LAFYIRLLGSAKMDFQLASVFCPSKEIDKHTQRIDALINDLKGIITEEFIDTEAYDEYDKQSILSLFYYINDPVFSSNVRAFDEIVKIYK